ncbi:hypothetical protein IAD21_03543 [Abditibacteriota bacterium]|nr:hypothetical protein IAD21_03543 [Abditibacteriota bacterium]
MKTPNSLRLTPFIPATLGIFGVFMIRYPAFGNFALKTITSPSKDYQLDAHLESRITTEIPMGAPRAQVMAWLVTNGVKDATYQSRKHIESAYVTNNSKFKPSQISGLITFGLEVGDSLLGRHSTYVIFFFGKKDRFLGDHVERQGTGL